MRLHEAAGANRGLRIAVSEADTALLTHLHFAALDHQELGGEISIAQRASNKQEFEESHYTEHRTKGEYSVQPVGIPIVMQVAECGEGGPERTLISGRGRLLDAPTHRVKGSRGVRALAFRIGAARG